MNVVEIAGISLAVGITFGVAAGEWWRFLGYLG